MEEEVYLIDIVALLSAQSGWIIFFILGIWVGLLLVNYNLAQIRRQLETLNQRTRGSDYGSLPLPKQRYIPENEYIGQGQFKYCEGCSSPTEMHKMECQACNGTSFVHKKPDAQK